MPAKRLLVVQVAALGWDLLRRHASEAPLAGLRFAPLQSVFPALTCPVQATFRTGLLPAAHGVVANGMFDRATRRTAFWEQSAALVEGPRIWDAFRARGRSVAMLFWQQSLGERVDLLLSPAPIHKHHGGMIQDCYSQPAGLYAALCRRVGRPFDLRHYWGPLASARSSDWIAAATCEVLAASAAAAPDLCLTYLPVLDYDLQRHGPDHARSRRALRSLLNALARLRLACERHGYELLVYGDYAIGACPGGAVFPNRALREAGLLATRAVGGMHYADLHASRAFAMVDHQVAHVYVPAAGDVAAVRSLLEALPGVAAVWDRDAQAAAGLAHSRGGELVVMSDATHWLAYPWWTQPGEAPEYAAHVDIHAKPGYDPCELFWGWPPGRVSRDTRRVGGAHGLVGAGREAAWAASFLQPEARTLVDLSEGVRQWLEMQA